MGFVIDFTHAIPFATCVEASRGGHNPSEIVSLTLDNALKGMSCRLPPTTLFEQFPRLQQLSLANAGLTSLEWFPSLPHLKRLILSDNRISHSLEHLVQAGLKSLEDLDLSNNRIQVLEDKSCLDHLLTSLKPLFICEYGVIELLVKNLNTIHLVGRRKRTRM
jgi:Leucine-rich repeat (LRR) protein